ncbi:MAG: hypothetical protein JNK85_30145 [Verrucomicrobiales bacterium]|nr:hypothetical protein [Verrucomicrobiales bacterium]
MEPVPASEEVRAICHRIAAEVTTLHRVVGRIREGPQRAEILRALFELTRNVEVVKKQTKLLDSGEATTLT